MSDSLGIQLRLADVEKAISARDPKCVDLLIQIASAPSAEQLNQTAETQPGLATNTPPAEGRYTFGDFRTDTISPKFYKQPADVQRQFRVEKISLLESDQADEPLSDRLRSFEIILKLWESDKSFERECLLDLLRRIPLVYGPWKAVKQIFKQAEARNDTEVLGILSFRFDEAVQRPYDCEPSSRTLKYLTRRAWRYLRNIGKTLPACYAETAVDFLVEYETPHPLHWTWNQIFYHEEKRYTRTRFQYSSKSATLMMKHRAFAELWQRSPLPLFSLLERAKSDSARSYATTALKTDFRNVIREVEPDWVKRLLSSNKASLQEFAIWVLENVPKFEQSKFRELGLHDAVLRLFNSRHTFALNYVAAYARTHSRDLPVDELIRLANCNRDSGKGSEAVRKLATDLLRSKDPRKEIGLDNWGLLLETQFANDFASKALREHFGAKDLGPEWFAERFKSDSEQAISFAVKNLLDIHPAKKLGDDYFYDLLLESFSSTTLVFCLSELEKLGLEQLEPKQLETLLLHPDSQVWSSVLGWVSSGKVAAAELDSEFLKSIAFKPTWAETPQVVEALKRQANQNLARNSDRSETVYEEAIADHIFGWLSDIRLFSPDKIGFDWLMDSLTVLSLAITTSRSKR